MYLIICKTDDFPGMSSASEMPLLVTTDIKLVDPSTEQVETSIDQARIARAQYLK